jgi:SH3 domain protein
MKIHIKIMLYAAILSCTLAVQDVSANQWFVKPSTEVPVRIGMGTKYRIVAIVNDGTAVNVTDRRDSWAKIRLANGREGWILRRFLSKEKPLAEQLIHLDLEKKNLAEKVAQTDARFLELTELNSNTEYNLSACIRERDEIRAEYEQLKIDTANVSQTKKKLIASEEKLEKLKKELAIMESRNRALENKSKIIWFLGGAGVLLSGWAIGLVTGKRAGKRRGSLL